MFPARFCFRYKGGKWRAELTGSRARFLWLQLCMKAILAVRPLMKLPPLADSAKAGKTFSLSDG